MTLADVEQMAADLEREFSRGRSESPLKVDLTTNSSRTPSEIQQLRKAWERRTENLLPLQAQPPRGTR